MRFCPENIQKRREELGLTREEVAQLTGLSYNAIWRIETGQREPMASTLGAIAKALQTRRISMFYEVE